MVFYLYFRGDCFRREFSRLGELRSVIPENVNVMALTATATVSTRREIIKILDMQKPVIVSIPPIKDNLFFCASPRGSISLSLSPIISDILIRQRIAMGRIIIFCSTYDEVTSIYYFFKKTLGINFTEPPGAPDLPQYRLIDMYHMKL